MSAGNEVLDEIYRVREEIAARNGNDLRRIFEDARSREGSDGRRVVSYEPADSMDPICVVREEPPEK